MKLTAVFYRARKYGRGVALYDEAGYLLEAREQRGRGKRGFYSDMMFCFRRDYPAAKISTLFRADIDELKGTIEQIKRGTI